MKIKRCPVCGSVKIGLYSGFITGSYRCEQCGYVGNLIIEEDIEKNISEKEVDTWQKRKKSLK